MWFALVQLPDRTVTVPKMMGKDSVRISLTRIRKTTAPTSPPENPPFHTEETIRPPAPVQTAATQVISPGKKAVPGIRPQSKKRIIEQSRPALISSRTSTAATEATPALSFKAVPLYAENPRPAYPVLARRRNWQGTVILSVRVSQLGTVDRVEIKQSSGHGLLDKAALKAVLQWRFRTGMEKNRPVAMTVLVPVHFRLR
jgi:protein TonB